ncbi:MAG: hypothetical protein IPK97_16580 [Ahniella sp.]|nr:hypothetical protein [Ahniella sp.]
MKKKPAKVERAADSTASKKAGKAPARPKSSAKAKVSKAKESPAKAEPIKAKRIRGSFSMPAADYALVGELKAISKSSGRTVKKNELLRAGLHALIAMSDQALEAALAALKPVKKSQSKKAK